MCNGSNALLRNGINIFNQCYFILYKVKCVKLNLKNPWKSENFENISYTVNLLTKDTKLRNRYFYK